MARTMLPSISVFNYQLISLLRTTGKEKDLFLQTCLDYQKNIFNAKEGRVITTKNASTRIVLDTFTLFHNINLNQLYKYKYALHYFSNFHRTLHISPLSYQYYYIYIYNSYRQIRLTLDTLLTLFTSDIELYNPPKYGYCIEIVIVQRQIQADLNPLIINNQIMSSTFLSRIEIESE